MTVQHTHRLPVKLTRWHERWLYATGGLLFASGIAWVVMHYLFTGHGDLGDTPHPSEPWWLRIHGAAAMAFLIAFGSLLPGHISRAWQARRNHRSGMFMIALISALIVTGYGLYYAGDEDSRPWISLVHWIIGAVAAAGLPLHVYLGRRKLATKRSGVAGGAVCATSSSAIGASQGQQVPKQHGQLEEKHQTISASQ